MGKILDTVLLLALPASGKSEVRRYLDELSPAECRDDFHMGPTVQLDDFPYVHLMRRVDDELAAIGQPRVFYYGPDKSFTNPLDWGTLVELVNQDYNDLVNRRVYDLDNAAQRLLDRLDDASAAVGAPRRMASLPADARAVVLEKLEEEARQLLRDKHANYPDTLNGKTLVIEFARGGPADVGMPLPEPLGYRYSVGCLAPEILEKAAILYIWTTPEESRRKNAERADPDDPGSILHHGVPLEVLINDYGCDDMDWLEANSGKPGFVKIESRNKSYFLPAARFDNRQDKTSFIRNDSDQWKTDEIEAVHGGLKNALSTMANYRLA